MASTPNSVTDKVTITINDQAHQVTPGSGTASRIKQIGHVPAEDQLLQVQGNVLVPLADDAPVEIVGGEVFVSRPNSGSSS